MGASLRIDRGDLAKTGALYVWMYPDSRRGYAGWHLTADNVMSTQLCATIDRMLAGSLSGPSVFPVSAATQSVLAVPNYRTNRPLRRAARSARQLVLKAVEDPRYFALNEDNGVLTVAAGKERLQELREHIRGITHGRGDLAMGPDTKRGSPRRPADQALWFWWMLQQRR